MTLSGKLSSEKGAGLLNPNSSEDQLDSITFWIIYGMFLVGLIIHPERILMLLPPDKDDGYSSGSPLSEDEQEVFNHYVRDFYGDDV